MLPAEAVKSSVQCTLPVSVIGPSVVAIFLTVQAPILASCEYVRKVCKPAIAVSGLSHVKLLVGETPLKLQPKEKCSLAFEENVPVPVTDKSP